MDDQGVQRVMTRTAQSVSFLAILLLLLVVLDNVWVAVQAFGTVGADFSTERVVTPAVVVASLGASTLGVAVPLVWAIHGHYALKRGK